MAGEKRMREQVSWNLGRGSLAPRAESLRLHRKMATKMYMAHVISICPRACWVLLTDTYERRSVLHVSFFARIPMGDASETESRKQLWSYTLHSCGCASVWTSRIWNVRANGHLWHSQAWHEGAEHPSERFVPLPPSHHLPLTLEVVTNIVSW